MKQLKFYNPIFENVVRNELLIFDRPITDEDALLVYDLDCSEFTFDIEDCETLCSFKNLIWLSINVRFENLSFLKALPNLEELIMDFYQSFFDCSYLSSLQCLRSLVISGGDLSGFEFLNFNALSQLSALEDLSLHEFGSVDLSALKDMTQLTGFFCGYANKVENIEAISHLIKLEGLTLIDIVVDNLGFLDTLSDDLILGLCGVEVIEKVDVNKLKRFKECSLDESVINGKKMSG